MIDLILFFAVVLISAELLSYSIGQFSPETVEAILLPAIPAGFFLYFILTEGLCNGQTLGKRALKIRVRGDDGLPIKFHQAIGRNLMRVADIFPGFYLIGFMSMFLNSKGQRIGDLVSRTVVVHERRVDPFFTPAPHALALHPLEERVGDLRGMTREEYVALRRFCDRYPQLPAFVQHKLLKEVWEPIAQRRRVPNIPNVHPLFIAEAMVMRYGRTHGLL